MSEQGHSWDLGIGLHCCGAFTDMVIIIIIIIITTTIIVIILIFIIFIIFIIITIILIFITIIVVKVITITLMTIIIALSLSAGTAGERQSEQSRTFFFLHVWKFLQKFIMSIHRHIQRREIFQNQKIRPRFHRHIKF